MPIDIRSCHTIKCALQIPRATCERYAQNVVVREEQAFHIVRTHVTVSFLIEYEDISGRLWGTHDVGISTFDISGCGSAKQLPRVVEWLQHTQGDLEAIFTWEDGSLTSLIASDGIVAQTPFDLVGELLATRKRIAELEHQLEETDRTARGLPPDDY